jgi:hypothetical protein
MNWHCGKHEEKNVCGEGSAFNWRSCLAYVLRLRSQRDDKGNFSTGRTVATAISVALIAVLATYAMFMVVQYREWLFFAYALDKRFT